MCTDVGISGGCAIAVSEALRGAHGPGVSALWRQWFCQGERDDRCFAGSPGRGISQVRRVAGLGPHICRVMARDMRTFRRSSFQKYSDTISPLTPYGHWKENPQSHMR